LLDDDAAAHGFERTIKNCNKTVASRFDDSAVVFCNAGLDEVALDAFHARMRTFFIELHEAAVAGDIACDDRSKATGRQPAWYRAIDIAIAHGVTLHRLKSTYLSEPKYGSSDQILQGNLISAPNRGGDTSVQIPSEQYQKGSDAARRSLANRSGTDVCDVESTKLDVSHHGGLF
jgi:hypothetical protein